MSVRISNGRLFRATVAIDDERLEQMRQSPLVAQTALIAGAEYWHTRVLPQHFQVGASMRYGYAPRAIKYLKNRNKAGKPPLVLTGSLRRDLQSSASFRAASKSSIDLRMSARVLNLARTVENSADLYLKHKNGVGYPNLKREIKAITDEEREAVAEVVTATVERLLGPTESKNTAIVRAA
jgi:hypothetical protein